MELNVTACIKRFVRYTEIAIAVIVLIGVFIYAFHNVDYFFFSDWSDERIFYDLIYKTLLITIGVEFARMLVTHNYESILELLAFVIARKMLRPDIDSLDIALGVISFVIVAFAARYFLWQKNKEQKKHNSVLL